MVLYYYGLELTLKKKARESGQIAFREADILKGVSHYEFTEESLKDIVHYVKMALQLSGVLLQVLA